MRNARTDRTPPRAVRSSAVVFALLILTGVLVFGGDSASAQPGVLRVSASGPYSGQVGERRRPTKQQPRYERLDPRSAPMRGVRTRVPPDSR